MAQLTAEILIAQPQPLVWQKIAAFTEVADANPYVHKSYAHNQRSMGVGAIRHCELNADGSQYSQEEIVQWRDGAGYSLTMIGGSNPPPVDNLSIDLDITPLDMQHSRLRMTFNYRPRWGALGSLLNRLIIRRMLRKVAQNTLAGYKLHIETGHKVHSLQIMEQLTTEAF